MGVWLVVDLICTLVFCAFALCSTIPMLKDIFGILMEKTHEINVCWMECSLKYRRTRYSRPACLGYHSREVRLCCHAVAKPGALPKYSTGLGITVKKTCKIRHTTI